LKVKIHIYDCLILKLGQILRLPLKDKCKESGVGTSLKTDD